MNGIVKEDWAQYIDGAFAHRWSHGISVKFDNGWGVSVISGSGAYCTPGKTYEVAILKDDKIDYDNPVSGTMGVLGWQRPDQVREILAKVRDLPVHLR